jgi:nucleoside-triphosphatase THEP1
MVSSSHAILVLSGDCGAGKTTACREATRIAAGRGLSVGGVLCPSRRDSTGAPVEIEVEALATGERRLLASRERDLGGARWPPEAGRGFSFSADCFAWALGILDEDLDGGTDLLILDEIGPLELVLHAGFWLFLEKLESVESRRGLLVATVRPSLVDALSSLPVFAASRRLELRESTRKAIPVAIADEASGRREKKDADR